MNTNPDSPDEYGDFEYQLESPTQLNLCAHCGGKLNADGECGKCGALMDKIEEINEDVELDEYGMPVGKRSEAAKGPFTGMLELEEEEDGELPAMFYAVALAVLAVVSLASVAFDAPVAATFWLGLLLMVGGVIVLAVGYQGMMKELGPWKEVSAMPLHAMVNMFSPGACETPPKHRGVALGKYSVLAILVGGLALGVSYLLGLVM